MISPLDTAGLLGAAPPPRGLPDASFAHLLAGAAGGRPEQAREAATQLVSSAFILPVLAARHESSFARPPFAAGFAEKRFAPLLDRTLADRIARAADFPLVRAIVERLMPETPPETPDG